MKMICCSESYKTFLMYLKEHFNVNLSFYLCFIDSERRTLWSMRESLRHKLVRRLSPVDVQDVPEDALEDTVMQAPYRAAIGCQTERTKRHCDARSARNSCEMRRFLSAPVAIAGHRGSPGSTQAGVARHVTLATSAHAS